MNRKKHAVDEMEVIKEMHREILGGPTGMTPEEALDYLERERREHIIDDMTYDNEFLARHEDYIRENWFDLIGPVKEELHNPMGRHSRSNRNLCSRCSSAVGQDEIEAHFREAYDRLGIHPGEKIEYKSGPGSFDSGVVVAPENVSPRIHPDDGDIVVDDGQGQAVLDAHQLADRRARSSRNLCSRCGRKRTAKPDRLLAMLEEAVKRATDLRPSMRFDDKTVIAEVDGATFKLTEYIMGNSIHIDLKVTKDGRSVTKQRMHDIGQRDANKMVQEVWDEVKGKRSRQLRSRREKDALPGETLGNIKNSLETALRVARKLFREGEIEEYQLETIEDAAVAFDVRR